jgi:hypothetical protein
MKIVTILICVLKFTGLYMLSLIFDQSWKNIIEEIAGGSRNSSPPACMYLLQKVVDLRTKKNAQEFLPRSLCTNYREFM